MDCVSASFLISCRCIVWGHSRRDFKRLQPSRSDGFHGENNGILQHVRELRSRMERLRVRLVVAGTAHNRRCRARISRQYRWHARLLYDHPRSCFFGPRALQQKPIHPLPFLSEHLLLRSLDRALDWTSDCRQHPRAGMDDRFPVAVDWDRRTHSLGLVVIKANQGQRISCPLSETSRKVRLALLVPSGSLVRNRWVRFALDLRFGRLLSLGKLSFLLAFTLFPEARVRVGSGDGNPCRTGSFIES